jgi:hypothetical protein
MAEIELGKQRVIERQMREIELAKNATELRELYAKVLEQLGDVKQEHDKLTLEKKYAIDKIQFFMEDTPRLDERRKNALNDQKTFKKEFKKKIEFLAETKEAYEKQEQQLCEEVAKLESKLLMEQERYKGEAAILDRELHQYKLQLSTERQNAHKAQLQTILAQSQRNRELEHAVGLNERYTKRASKLFALQERLKHRIIRLGYNEDFLQQELESILSDFQYHENVENVDFQDNLDLVSLSSTSMTDNSPSPSPRRPRKSPRSQNPGKSPRTPGGKRVNMQGTAELFLLKKFKAESDLLDQLRTLSRKYVESLKDYSVITEEQKKKIIETIDKYQERHDKKKQEWVEKTKTQGRGPPKKEEDLEETSALSEASDGNSSDMSTASALGSTITDYDEETPEATEDDLNAYSTVDQDIAMRLDTYDVETTTETESKDMQRARMALAELTDWTKLSRETDRLERMIDDIVTALAKSSGVSNEDFNKILNDVLTPGKPLRKITTVFGEMPMSIDEDREYDNLNDDIFYDVIDEAEMEKTDDNDKLNFNFLKTASRVMASQIDNQPPASSQFLKTQQSPLKPLDRKVMLKVKDEHHREKKAKKHASRTESIGSNINDISDDNALTGSVASDYSSEEDSDEETLDEDVNSALSKVKFSEVKRIVVGDFRESQKFAVMEDEENYLKKAINKYEIPIGFNIVKASPWHTSHSTLVDEDDDEDDLALEQQNLIKKLSKGETFNLLCVTAVDEGNFVTHWEETTIICDTEVSALIIKRHVSGDARRWQLDGIKDVLPGFKTVEFLRFGDPSRVDHSFSIIHSKGILNLEVPSDASRDEWVKIILVAKAKNSVKND